MAGTAARRVLDTGTAELPAVTVPVSASVVVVEELGALAALGRGREPGRSGLSSPATGATPRGSTSRRVLAMRWPAPSRQRLSMERETGFEPATLSLGRGRNTKK
jgi:hypothetical protein